MLSTNQLHTEGDVECSVHPVVLFSIVDHYSRREDGQERVIGTLLGTVNGNKIEVCSCFPVPHTETEEQVAVNTDFHSTMLQLHRRVHPKHTVVGWYSTGEDVNEGSILFHECYGSDVERPVHMLVDLGLGERRMSSKAYISKTLELGALCLGTVFREVKLAIVNAEADKIGIETLMKSASASNAGGSSQVSEADSMEVTIKKLLRTLEGVGEYVEKVNQGEVTPDPRTITLLQEAMSAAPRLPTSTFDKIFNSQVQDMLVVVYLANLTRAQLALAEKLQDVAAAAAST